MSHGLKLLLLAAGTIITLLVVTVSFRLAKQSKEIDHKFSNHLEEIDRELESSDFTMYDGVMLYGSDVVNFLKRQLSSYDKFDTAPIKITVITSITPKITNTYVNREYFKEIQNFTDSKYIKPTDQYLGELIYNQNNMITELIFTIQ